MAAFVKNLFRGGPKTETPAVPALPPPPTQDTASLALIAERRKKRMGLSAPARSGTQLTGPAGLAAPAPTERTSLLGG